MEEEASGAIPSDGAGTRSLIAYKEGNWMGEVIPRQSKRSKIFDFVFSFL